MPHFPPVEPAVSFSASFSNLEIAAVGAVDSLPFYTKQKEISIYSDEKLATGQDLSRNGSAARLTSTHYLVIAA